MSLCGEVIASQRTLTVNQGFLLDVDVYVVVVTIQSAAAFRENAT